MTAPDFATSPKRRPHYKSDFVFVRGDGWALGTDKGHVFWAHRTWAKEWKWVIVMKEFSGPQVITIEEWREKFAKGEL